MAEIQDQPEQTAELLQQARAEAQQRLEEVDLEEAAGAGKADATNASTIGGQAE